MELVFGLLMMFIAWAGIYLAVRFGVRDAMRGLDKERSRAGRS